MNDDFDYLNSTEFQSLESALKQQVFERNDTKTFSKECLFCKRFSSNGIRADYINHLWQQHNFNVGHPHNLVYVDDLLERIEDCLQRLQCVYCERTFPNRDTLKEHMRKKGHKRLNRSNGSYDRFYIVNYLTNIASLRPTDKSQRCISDHFNSTLDEDVDGTEITTQENIHCLFCAHFTYNIETLYEHMRITHKFDFPLEMRTKQFDYYFQMKFVNYTRKMLSESTCIYCGKYFKDLPQHLQRVEHCKIPDNYQCFDRIEFYFPTLQNDMFLFYLMDDEEDEE